MSPRKTTRYDANDMTALEGLEAVRKRPGMYVGTTDTKGRTHLCFEVLDNAVDEAIAGHCSEVTLTLFEDGSVEVSDNGRGIPVDQNTKTKMSGVEMVFTKLHAGGKFGGGGYATAGGLHGVGAAVVNALSTRVDVDVQRGGNLWQVSFQRGAPGVFAGEGPEAGFIAKKGLRKGKKVAASRTGTTVRYWPDESLFLAGSSTDGDAVIARARQTAFLVPGLAVTVRDLRDPNTPVEETFAFKGGSVDMVDYLSSDEKINDPVHLTGEGTYTEQVPMPDNDGNLVTTEVERVVRVDVALRWGKGYDPTVRSFVNVVATPKGGTHVKGFERGLVTAIRKGYDGTRLMKANEDPVTVDDCLEGLTAVVSVSVPEPQFVGQTKEELGTTGVTKAVQTVVAEGVANWLKGRKKAQGRLVLEKIANAARARIASRTQREAARRKTALAGASMPAKLVDCRATGVARSELFIVEGDSALGSARAARNSEYQALLPIRGKILNVQKATLAQVLNNNECSSIIQVIGAGSGRNFDVGDMRYGRTIIMADADVDGSHIRTLLITLFFKYMRPLVEEGRLYTAVPPLFKVETTGKNKDSVYAYSVQEMEAIVARLEKAGKTVKKPIPRYKGLGEMDAGELFDTTMDPTSRMVRQITLPDAQAATDSLELLMGDAVEPRREFLLANAPDADTIDA